MKDNDVSRIARSSIGKILNCCCSRCVCYGAYGAYGAKLLLCANYRPVGYVAFSRGVVINKFTRKQAPSVRLSLLRREHRK